MKKAIVSTVLICMAVRLAVLVGAGDALASWVRELDPGSFIPAAADIAPSEAEAHTETAAETAAGEAASESAWLLVAVTPAPEVPEEGSSLGEKNTVPTIAADFSAEELVHNSTSLSVDIAELAAAGPELTLEPDTPQVLIFHTHSSEAYTPDDIDRYEASDPYRTEDRNYSVIRIGDALTEKLEACGLTVIHDREIYDYPSYTGSYNRSGAAVEKYLAEHPSIKVVIDLHRDALGSGDVVYKTQAAVSGKTCAQVMMLIGTGENGLWHPNWQQNLKLALCLQQAVETSCPGLARPIELVSERYNQQLSPGMMILEVGSSGNTLREALTAIDLFGEAAGKALAERIKTAS